MGQGRRKNLIVMPVDPQKWTHPPFGATLWTHPKHGPCIVSRGAVNSKGALSGLFNAIRTIREVGKLPLDLTFVIDGEEEIGSPSFEHAAVLIRAPELAALVLALDPTRLQGRHLFVHVLAEEPGPRPPQHVYFTRLSCVLPE